MKNRFGLPKELKRKVVAIYDNGGETTDRYAVYYSRRIAPANLDRHCYLAMNSAPFHPQGFGQHGEGMIGAHNGKAIKFDALPADCKQAIFNDLDL